MFDFIKRMFGTRQPSFTTEERKKTDIRRPGGHIPGGDELGKRSVPEPAEEVSFANHLGKAAEHGNEAKQAIKERRFDDAWRSLNEQQSEWLSHASRFGFTKEQTLSLAGSVHSSMANVLRLEKKHDEALAHMLYFGATQREPVQGAFRKKLGAYFRRCKFGDQYGEDRAVLAVEMLGGEPDFRIAQEIVSQWRNGTAPTGKD